MTILYCDKLQGGKPPKYFTHVWISLKTDPRLKKWRADSSEVDNRPESAAAAALARLN